MPALNAFSKLVLPLPGPQSWIMLAARNCNPPVIQTCCAVGHREVVAASFATPDTNTAHMLPLSQYVGPAKPALQQKMP